MSLPPLPLQDLKSLPYSLQEWLRRLGMISSGTVGSVPWANVDKTGSNLTDLVIRLHNDLQSIQGGAAGEYNHLTNAQHTELTGFSGISGTGYVKRTGAATYSTSSTIPTSVITGTTTNDSATAGNIGEFLSTTVATGSSVALTTATTANVTSISLTAGDWDVWGVVDYTFDATTSFTELTQGISTTSATLGSQDTYTKLCLAANVPNPTNDPCYVTPTVRVSLASTTTVYLVSQARFTVSTLKAYGTIRARRIR